MCDGKQCGPDACGGECGTCNDGASCNGAGACVKPTDDCPTGPSDTPFWQGGPHTWTEGQCIVRWSHDQSVIRAHYHEPGHVLYASRHETNGNVGFSSSGFLQNLSVDLLESLRFCEEAPSGGSCVRTPMPDCNVYAQKTSCDVLFHWEHDGSAIRLRKTGTTLWAENQGTDGVWRFTTGGWMDASGGLGVPNAGKICFASTQPGGSAEVCP